MMPTGNPLAVQARLDPWTTIGLATRFILRMDLLHQHSILHFSQTNLF